MTTEYLPTPCLSCLLQSSRISSGSRKGYSFIFAVWHDDWAQNLQSSPQRPLRPLMIEHKSALSPRSLRRISSAPLQRESKSSSMKKAKSSSLFRRLPFIISSAILILIVIPPFDTAYYKQADSNCQLYFIIWLTLNFFQYFRLDWSIRPGTLS